MTDSSLSFVPTRCSALKNIAVQYQEVVYENPSKNKINSYPVERVTVTNNQLPTCGSSSNYSSQEFDIKRLKYEIKRFAKLNGNSLNKEKSIKELAIELGARPSRKKAIPYKELLYKKNRQKILDQKLLDKIKKGKEMKKPFKKKKKPENKDRSHLLDIYGKVTSQNNKKVEHRKNRR